MKTGLIASLILNLMLITFGGWIWLQPLPPSASVPTPAVVLPPPATTVWSQVESTDYPTYIANLRKTGCPEVTIRNIVKAEIAETFEQERQQIRQSARTTVAGEALSVSQQLKALDQEQDQVLTHLLGLPPVSSLGSPSKGQTTSASGATTSTSTTENSAAGPDGLTPLPTAKQDRVFRSPWTPEEEAYRQQWGWQKFNEWQMQKQKEAQAKH
jgi:hypothetical protein